VTRIAAILGAAVLLLGPAVPAAGPPATGPAPPLVEVRGTRLTVRAAGVALDTLLQDIALRAGVAIDLPPGLTEPTTVSLSGVPLDVGLRRLLGRTGFVMLYGPSGTVVRVVVPPPPARPAPGERPPAAPGPSGAGAPVEDLRAALASRSRAVREAAVQAIAETGRRDLVPLLAPALRDGDAWIRSLALDALADLGGPEAVGLLATALRDPDAGVRARALRALRRAGGAAAIPFLRAALEDQDPRVREEARETLDELTGPPARD